MRDLTGRVCAAVLAMAAAAFAWRAFDTARTYNHTFDEPTQIASGLELLQYGRFELHLDVPPLAKVLMAAPLYVAGVRLEGAPQRGRFDEANEVLYGGNYWARLRTARAVSTALGLVLLVALYAMALRLFGPLPAAVTAVAASVSPGLVSAASIANSDMAGVLTVLAAMYAFRRWLESPSSGRAAVFGLALALAVLTKLSAIPFLLFSLPAIAWFTAGPRIWTALRHPVEWWRARSPEILVVAAVVPLTIWAGYGFQLAPPLGPAQAANMAAALEPRWPSLARAVAALAYTGVPLGSFFRGMGVGWSIAHAGHPAFLMGQYSLHGWPQYFLVTLALKLPIGLLLAALASAVLAAWRRHTVTGREVMMIAAIAVAVLLSVMKAGVNAGHRHVVIVEALFALMIGGGLALAWQERGPRAAALAGIVAVAVIGGVVASARAHPDALGYTNAFAGSHPDRFLADSNLDWGQDLDRLKRWLDERGVHDPIHLAFFGTARPQRHGLRSVPLEPGDRPEGVVAVSVQCLRGLCGTSLGRLPTQGERDACAWLLDVPEAGRIGTSLRVYRLSAKDLQHLSSKPQEEK